MTTKKLFEGWRRFLSEGDGTNQLAIFFLIGPPSVGKSHWLNHEGPKHGIADPYIISMDDVTDLIGDKHGFDYDDMFMRPVQPGQEGYEENQYSEKYGEMIDQPLEWKKWEPKVWSKVSDAQIEAMNEHDRIVKAAGSSDRPVVVDMTNMTQAGRQRLIDQINAPNRRLVAVAFDWNNDVEHLKTSSAKRAKERFETTGRKKTIPGHVFDRMTGGYQPPEESEGWDEIIEVPAWWAQEDG